MAKLATQSVTGSDFMSRPLARGQRTGLIISAGLSAIPVGLITKANSVAKTGVKSLLGQRVSAVGNAAKTTSIAPYFPSNSGFIGQTKKQFLMPSQLIDRYGGSGYSRYFSPVGTPQMARSLPASSLDSLLEPLR